MPPFSWARRVALAAGVCQFACRMRPQGADKGVLIRWFALWRKAFGGAGFACMDLQRWCLSKSFFTSPRVCMRVRARECMCKKRGAVGAESIKAPKDKESSGFKCWCKYGAEVVQVGAVVVFIIIIYLYLFLLIINSYLYISIFSSKIDFSLCEYLT